eukprot:4690676-Pleurochrysis_carterae.AAC.2
MHLRAGSGKRRAHNVFPNRLSQLAVMSKLSQMILQLSVRPLKVEDLMLELAYLRGTLGTASHSCGS